VGDSEAAETFQVILDVWDVTDEGPKIYNNIFTNTVGKTASPAGYVPECTAITCQGTNAVIRGNTFENWVFDVVNQQSPNHGITLGGVNSALIENNLFTNFQGDCIYTDSWINKNVTIRNNTFNDVWIFLYFSCQTWPDVAQISDSSNYDVHHNVINLTDGDFLYEWDLPGIPTTFVGFVYSANNNLYRGFENIVVHDNRVKLGITGGSLTSYPLRCFSPGGATVPESKIKLYNNIYINKLIVPPSVMTYETTEVSTPVVGNESIAKTGF
jgi:hypothetical protein